MGTFNNFESLPTFQEKYNFHSAYQKGMDILNKDNSVISQQSTPVSLL